MTHMGKESKKEWIYAYIYITDSLCCKLYANKKIFNKNKIKSVII